MYETKLPCERKESTFMEDVYKRQSLEGEVPADSLINEQNE